MKNEKRGNEKTTKRRNEVKREKIARERVLRRRRRRRGRHRSATHPTSESKRTGRSRKALSEKRGRDGQRPSLYSLRAQAAVFFIHLTLSKFIHYPFFSTLPFFSGSLSPSLSLYLSLSPTHTHTLSLRLSLLSLSHYLCPSLSLPPDLSPRTLPAILWAATRPWFWATLQCSTRMFSPL